MRIELYTIFSSGTFNTQMTKMVKHTDLGYEANRLRELKSYNILDTLTEEDYDNITYMASVICDVPIAVISFVDENRQWFKSQRGLKEQETLREYSFCAHAINNTQEFLIIPDSRKDKRFVENPLVTGDPNIVFYAGVPLVSGNGYGLGTVCVIDRKPRELTEQQLTALKMLSSQVMQMLETSRMNAKLEKTRRQLEIKNRDLEESKRKLEKSESRLRTMSEGTDVLITVVDEENEATFITKAWSNLTGKSLEELLLFGWTELVHPDDRERYKDTYMESFENRAAYSVEFRILNSSGNYTCLLSQGSPQILQDGSFAGYISSTSNISERKITETALSATTRKLELALEAGRIGTYDMNLKSGNMKTSARYNQNFGLDPEAKCNYSGMLSVVYQEDRPAVHKALSAAVRNNDIYDATFRITQPAGATRWIHSVGVPVFDAQGEAVGLSGVSIDVTDQH